MELLLPILVYTPDPAIEAQIARARRMSGSASAKRPVAW